MEIHWHLLVIIFKWKKDLKCADMCHSSRKDKNCSRNSWIFTRRHDHPHSLGTQPPIFLSLVWLLSLRNTLTPSPPVKILTHHLQWSQLSKIFIKYFTTANPTCSVTRYTLFTTLSPLHMVQYYSWGLFGVLFFFFWKLSQFTFNCDTKMWRSTKKKKKKKE